MATERKEKLQEEIEMQILQGGDGLEEEDIYLLDIRLDDLEGTSGETQEYWLLAITAARKASILFGQHTVKQTESLEETGKNLFLISKIINTCSGRSFGL